MHSTLRHISQSMYKCMINYQSMRFVSKPETPDPDMNLPNLQFWNCMDYGVVSITKQFIGSMDFELYTRDHGIMKGTYICTIDNYHSDPDVIDYLHQKIHLNTSHTISLSWRMEKVFSLSKQ